jgi:23S rRNA pseudouridine1911/1915/1917 synthase
MLDILYKDNQCIVINKATGVPVQPDKTKDETLQSMTEAYCHHPLHAVHRIDRPVSGIVLFAKSARANTNLQKQFQERTVEKIYLAFLQEKPKDDKAELVHFLKKNEAKNTVMAYAEERPGTEKAVLRYELVGSTVRYHLVRIALLTGRHHQIRAQMAAIGCPVKGDVKYGATRGNPDRSIHLHAWRLALDHPVSGERLQLEAPLPAGDALWQEAPALLKALLGK